MIHCKEAHFQGDRVRPRRNLQALSAIDAFWKCGASFAAARQLLAAGYRCCAPEGKVASALEIVKAKRPKDEVQQSFLISLIKATEKKVRTDRKARANA